MKFIHSGLKLDENHRNWVQNTNKSSHAKKGPLWNSRFTSAHFSIEIPPGVIFGGSLLALEIVCWLFKHISLLVKQRYFRRSEANRTESLKPSGKHDKHGRGRFWIRARISSPHGLVSHRCTHCGTCGELFDLLVYVQE